jgi:hypothetical protein
MNTLVKKFPVLGSSVDPEKLSLTVKGILGLIATLLVYFGVRIEGLDVNSLTDQLVNLVVLSSGIITAGTTLYGVLRKFKVNK